MNFLSTYTFRIIVCGSRHWTDEAAVWRFLDQQLEAHHLETFLLAQGDAPGADLAAKMWAEDRQVDHMSFPARWRRHHRAAGPIRNRRQLIIQPHLVAAFHDDLENSKGTKNMVEIARQFKYPTRVLKHKKRPA